MCHLDSMRVAQNPLPLPEPYDKLWLSVTKVQHVDSMRVACTESFASIPEPYDKLWLSVTKVQHVSLRHHEGQNPLPLYQSPMICCGYL